MRSVQLQMSGGNMQSRSGQTMPEGHRGGLKEMHAALPGEGATVVSSAVPCFPFHSIRLATRMTLILSVRF